MFRLTHDGRTRHHEQVELGDLVLDIVKWEWFAVLAVENVKEVLQYGYAFTRPPKTEPPLRGVLKELESISQVLNLPQNKHTRQENNPYGEYVSAAVSLGKL